MQPVALEGHPDLECSQSKCDVTMNPSQIVLSLILALSLVAAPLPSGGEQPAKVYRIGYLGAGLPTPASSRQARNWEVFVEGLRERGYIEGQNFCFEQRYTEGKDERALPLAIELVSLKPDLIVAYGTAQVRAAKEATSTIPIVMVGVIDPVRRGLVASLGHPGGNVTGLTATVGVEILGKRLQVLKETLPKVSRVAVLYYSGGQSGGFSSAMEEAARPLDVTLLYYGVRDPEELESVFAAMAKARLDALLVDPHPLIANHSGRIAALAAQSRLPAVYPFREAVEAGGLMAYEASQSAIYRRLSLYVDKILNGAKPGDLAVEQPTKFELIINLKTAKTLGLTIPEPLLIRADEIIH